MNTYIFIPGGEVFSDESEYRDFIGSTLVDWNLEQFSVREEKKKWKIELAKKLTEQGDGVYMPNFPNTINAHYAEWKLFFEAWIDRIEIVGSLTLIGHSLGGNFLLKYFGEIERYDGNPETATQEKINLLFLQNIHLHAACISEGDFTAPENYDVLRSLGSKVHIWHAEDDIVVPFAVAVALQRELPDAVIHFFGVEAGYGHFHGIERLPELEAVIFKK